MASSTVKITIIGDQALQAKLATMEERFQKKLLRKGLRAAAKPVLASAKRLIPKDERKAEKSLKINARKRSRRYKHSVGVKVWTNPKWLKKIIDESGGMFNPHWIEFGAPGHKSWGKAIVSLPPQPFMRPALDQNKSTVASILAAEVRRLIAGEAKV